MKLPAWLRSWAGIAVLISFALGISGILSLAFKIGTPFGGYISYSVALDDIGFVAVETPGWWPIFQLGYSGFSPLLTINGLPYTPNARAIFEQTYLSSDVQLEWISSAQNAELMLKVPVLPFTWEHFLDLKLPEIIVATSFWILGLIVLRANPQGPTNRIFALITALIAAHRLLNIHSIFLDNRLVPNLFEAALLIVSSLLGPAAFHFAWLYPTPVPSRPRKIIGFIYGVGFIIAIALVGGRVIWWPPGVSPPNVTLTTIAYQALLFLYLLGLLTLIGRLIYLAVRQHSSRRERRILAITIIGIMFALPFLILVAGEVIPVLPTQLYWNSLDIRALLIAVPFTLALAIVRYQTLGAPSRLFIFVAVLAGSALIANVAAWIWLLAQPTTSFGSTRPPFIPLFISIFIASLFWSMQTTWRGWLGRFFQRDVLNYSSTRNLGRRLRRVNDLRALPQFLVQAIVDELELECSAVWLAAVNDDFFTLAAQAGQVKENIPDRLKIPEIPPTSKPLHLPTTEKLPPGLAPLANQRSIEIVVPLYNDDEPVALLGFGRRWDEEIFDERDLVIIELIAQQALLYLQVMRQVEELRLVPQKVSTAQERERTLLAAELHDTIQQFLGQLPFFLMTSKEAMTDDPQEAADLLERSIQDIEEAARTVQQIRYNLVPNQLEHSLTLSLNALVSHVHQRHGIDIPLILAGDIDGVTPLETRLTLYRVIQHALDNAVMHAEADTIQVALRHEDSRVTFSVVDNGRGSTLQERQQAQATGHFGLQAMQARLEAYNGEFSFQSTVGKGTIVSGWVPTHQNATK